jgi:hypothetical protein
MRACESYGSPMVRDRQGIPLGFHWVNGRQVKGSDGQDDMQDYHQVSVSNSLHGYRRPCRNIIDLNRQKTHHMDA